MCLLSLALCCELFLYFPVIVLFSVICLTFLQNYAKLYHHWYLLPKLGSYFLITHLVVICLCFKVQEQVLMVHYFKVLTGQHSSYHFQIHFPN